MNNTEYKPESNTLITNLNLDCISPRNVSESGKTKR